MAIDFGNVGAGAAAGWGLGSFAGPVGSGAGALLGGIAGLFGDSGSEGTAPSAQVLYGKDYPWMTTAYQDLTRFGMGEVERSRQGLAPQWWEKLRPQVTEQAMGDLSSAYLGTKGLGPGILGYQSAYDVSRGLGEGGAATRAMGTQLDQWGTKAKDISTYMAGLTGQYSQRASEFFPQMVAGLPQGQRMAGIAQFPGQPGEASQFQQMAGSIGQMMPWLSGGMNPNQQQQQQQQPYPGIGTPGQASPAGGPGAQSFGGYGGGNYGAPSPPATVGNLDFNQSFTYPDQLLNNYQQPLWAQTLDYQQNTWQGVGQNLNPPNQNQLNFNQSFTYPDQLLQDYQLPWYAR